MIRIGIFFSKNSDKEVFSLVNSFKELSVVYPLNIRETEGIPVLENKRAITLCDAVYLAGNKWNSEEFRMILREEAHLYCETIPLLSLEEAKKNYELELEAGCVVQFFHPYIFLPCNINKYKKLQSPFFINGQLKFDIADNLEQQILYFLLFVLSIDNSLLSRSEVFSLESGKTFSVLNISLYFLSGSVVRLNLSPLVSVSSDISVYQRNNSRLSFSLFDNRKDKIRNSKRSSFEYFLKSIDGKPSLNISFTQIYQATRILYDIKEKLRFHGSSLLETDFKKEKLK